MTVRIGEVKAQLQAACDNELPAFITQYEGDERAGVRKCVEAARKRMESLEREKLRTEKLWEYERGYSGYSHICGIDEAGRGPLAGPVVAGAVIFQRIVISYILMIPNNYPKKRERNSIRPYWRKPCAGGWAMPLPRGLMRSIYCRPPMRPCGRPSASCIPSRICFSTMR